MKSRVIVVHGLWMNSATLMPLAHRLAGENREVRRFGYPSWHHTFDDNVAALGAVLAEERAHGVPVHLVGHSMGGLVSLAAAIAAGVPGATPMRLVMMGSPFEGSHCATTLSGNPLLAPVFGHSLPQWLARPRPAVPDWLEVGVIAGRDPVGLGHLLVPTLPTPNDGVVAVLETVVPGARDALCLNVNHMGMLLSRACAREADHFLETGAFLHGPEED